MLYITRLIKERRKKKSCCNTGDSVKCLVVLPVAITLIYTSISSKRHQLLVKGSLIYYKLNIKQV